MSDDSAKAGEENGGNANQENSGEDKDKFSPGQQKLVDDLYGEAFGKGMTKAEAASKEAIEKLNAKIVELETNKGNKEEDNREQHTQDLTALKDVVEGLKKKLSQTESRESRATIQAIAADFDAIDSEQVATLVAPFIKQEGNKTLVLNDKGDVKFNGKGDEMTVKELIKEYLGKNSHLVKAPKNNGAGSQGARGGDHGGVKVIKRSTYEKMTPTEQSKHTKSGGTLVD